MRLTLGPTDLQTDFTFSIFRRVAGITTVAGKIALVPKRVGIFLSGGLDSTALLALVLEEIRRENLAIEPICFTVDKAEGQSEYSKDIVAHFEARYGTITHHIIQNAGHQARPGRIGSTAYETIATMYDGIVFYQGLNNPPRGLTPFGDGFEGYKDVDTVLIHGRIMHFPFLRLHKPQIVDILYQLGHDCVIPLTQSCTERSRGQCGTCFWCEERQWGFDSLGKRDPLELRDKYHEREQHGKQ